jgi:hypothetical protein
MRKPSREEVVKHKPEGPQANADIPEEIILLPEREANSVAHIASPRLANPDQAKDFEMQVFTE